MMIENVVRDIQVLARADSLIGRIWVAALARRFGLFALAALIAVFGLGMIDVAAFYALERGWGAVWAAAVVGAADLIVALVIMLLARGARPGPEMELAFDVRKMAFEALLADSGDIKLDIESLGRQLRQTKDTVAGFVQHPLDTAAEHLLIPAVLSILRGLRSKKQQT